MIYFYMMFLSCTLMALSLALNKIYKINNTGSLTRNGFSYLYAQLISKMFGFFSYFTLFMVGAIRYEVGTDYTTYSLFQIPRVLMDSPDAKVEPLYKIVVKIGAFLGSGQLKFQWIFVLTQFLIILFIAFAINNLSQRPVFSIALFILSTFYNFALSGMRQSIGIAIFLFAIRYVKSNEFFKYLICIMIAALFHKFSLIYIPIYFLKYFKVNLKFSLIATPFIYAVSGEIRTLIYKVTSAIGFYSEYFGSKFDHSGTVKMTHVVFVLLCTMFIILIQYFVDDEYINSKEFLFFMNVQALLTMFMGIVNVIPTSSRLIYSFFPLIMFSIPNMLNHVKNKIIRRGFICIMLIISAVFFYKCILVNNFYGTLPYKTIFNY